MRTRGNTAGRVRTGLLLSLIAAALALMLLSLPLCEFTSSVYSKRLGNTKVGDEKYVTARSEAEAELARHIQETGRTAELREDVLERVNSKGVTTTMITLTVEEKQTRSGWAFMASGLTAGRELLLLAACVALSGVFLAVSVLRSPGKAPRQLSGMDKGLRGAACWLALAALIILPVFMLTCNVELIRRVSLGAAGLTDATATVSRIDRFLFEGKAGENALTMAAGMSLRRLWPLWALLPVLAALLCGAILVCRGSLGAQLARGALYLFVIVLCVLILYPYYVMLITAFRDNAESTDMNFLHLWPTRWLWGNLNAIVDRGVLQYLGNSILLAGGATAIALLCGIPAAYAMARMRFRGRNAYLGFIIMSQMFAPVVLLVGISTLMRNLGLNDSIPGLMLINAAFNQAFAVWLLHGTFRAISPEMEQAACIDGCGTVGALIRVLLPMAMPGVVTTLIFVFINAWNEYTISTVLISTPAKRPITVGITQFSSFNMIEWHLLFASALLATIPVVILFMCIEKHLVSGLTAGGVKG